MKSEKDKQKERGLAMHLEGKTNTNIAKELKVSRNTIQKWKKERNWAGKRKQQIEKIEQKVVKQYSDLEAKHTELTYKAIIEAINRLPDMKDMNVVSLTKLSVPTHQTKVTQEINKGIIYQFEVKNANTDTKDTIIKKAARSIPNTE